MADYDVTMVTAIWTPEFFALTPFFYFPRANISGTSRAQHTPWRRGAQQLTNSLEVCLLRLGPDDRVIPTPYSYYKSFESATVKLAFWANVCNDMPVIAGKNGVQMG